MSEAVKETPTLKHYRVHITSETKHPEHEMFVIAYLEQHAIALVETICDEIFYNPHLDDMAEHSFTLEEIDALVYLEKVLNEPDNYMGVFLKHFSNKEASHV